MISCCFFGHREVYEDIDKGLERNLISLITKEGVTRFFVGNHGGFDSKVITKLAELKKCYPQISCYIVLAYLPRNQDQQFKLDTIYPEGLERVPKKYAIVYRNKWMIVQSNFVVTYVKYETGGAANFKKIAERKGKVVINIAIQ